MRARWFLLTVGLLAATLAPQAGEVAHGRAQTRTGQTREAAWRADLAFFAREFPAAQVDFAGLYPRARFDADLAAITRALPSSADTDVTLALMGLVAGAHVAHTNVRFPAPPSPIAFHRLPLTFAWFSDGLAVTGASEPYRDSLGLRIAAIGALTPAQLEQAVAPYVSYENDIWLHQQSPSFMVVAEVLRAAGQMDADGTVGVTLARPDGTRTTIHVQPGPGPDAPQIGVVDALHLPPTLARKEPARYYRYEFLPDAKALYIRYSRCRDDPQQPFAAFARELLAAVDANPRAVERVVIDLRGNGGGDSAVIAPLLNGLRARKLTGRARLFGLVGPATFSSGLMAAINLRDDLKATLIGEPPGEKPNSYGEVRQLTLANSGLVVQYSTKFFRLAKKGDPITYEPDIVVKRSIGDWLGGRDPVLSAALGHNGGH